MISVKKLVQEELSGWKAWEVIRLVAAKHSNRILFVDTDALTTLFYSHFLLTDDSEVSRCTKLAETINEISEWDLVLFLEPTVDFVPDDTRSEIIAGNREKYSRQIKDLLHRYNLSYHSIGGDYLHRFTEAKRLIQKQLDISTQW